MASQILTGSAKAARRAVWWFLVVGLAGCFGDGIQSTIRPATDSTEIIQHVYALVTWIDIGIFIVVAGLMLIAMVRYRESKQQNVDIPKQVHGNTMVEIVWTTVPAILLIFIAVPTWQGIFRAAAPPTEGALQVKAIGHQWWWEFQYPELGLTTANELHVPTDRAIVVETYSKDVIHSFWLPRLAAKIDALPGKSNTIWFTAPSEPGEFYGQCAEFCGTSHANMRMRTFVETPSDFDAWVARTQQPPTPATPEAQEGQTLFMQKGCPACHTITGVPGAVGIIGPNLTNLHDRTTIAAALLPNTPENLARWIQHPQEVKPGALMIVPLPVNEQEAEKIGAFLTSEPGEGAAAMAAPAQQPAAAAPAQGGGAGTIEDAKALIAAKGCGACHIFPDVPGAVGTIGPDQTHLATRDTIAGGHLKNTPENIRKWLKNPPAVKPGTLMPNLNLTDQEIDTLMVYLETLK